MACLLKAIHMYDLHAFVLSSILLDVLSSCNSLWLVGVQGFTINEQDIGEEMTGD